MRAQSSGFQVQQARVSPPKRAGDVVPAGQSAVARMVARQRCHRRRAREAVVMPAQERHHVDHGLGGNPGESPWLPT